MQQHTHLKPGRLGEKQKCLKLSVLIVATAMLRSVAALAPLRASFRSSASPRILGPTEPSRLVRLFASTSDDQKGAKKEAKPKQKKITKWKLNPNITQDNADRLALAFDEMARKEGFDGSSAHFAQDATFEDDFEYDLDDEDREIDDEDLDPDMIFDADDEGGDDDDDFIDFGGRPGQSMEERIAAAQRDMDFGTITVPKGLDSFSEKATFDQLKKLGYKRELNPFGNDETPRREQFLLSTDALTCSACGSDFQSKNEGKPGFLPVEKHDIQRKLAKMEELRNMQEKADSSNAEWSPDDEIDYLLSITDGEKKDDNADKFARLDIDSVAEELGLDFNELSKKKVICKRCHGLQNFGKVDEVLRPGWTDEPLLSQKQFRDLLLPLKQKPAVIIAIVDLFDFSGSVLPELDNIAGKNPVLLAANKADLLPDKLGPNRAQNWVRRELEYLGVKSIANIGGAVRLISCKTGFGIPDLLRKARSLAEDLDCEIYVVGAANAGKSSFINHILERNNMTPDNEEKEKKRPGNQTSRKGALTTSPLPGTTLKFIKIKLGDGRVLYDTPGLLIPGTLTQLLTPEELKIVVPTK
jgi:hypothetical protein